MRDIDIAKTLLLDESLALVVVKDEEIIYKSKDRGIKPLYTAYKEMKNSLQGASLADKVIGKAAAMLCEDMEISGLYTNLISEKAIGLLDKTEIEFSYGLAVPFIKNRDGTGLCPVEKISLEVENIDKLLKEIDKF